MAVYHYPYTYPIYWGIPPGGPWMLIEVDWNNDGDYTDAYDDMGEDVRIANTAHGKDERLPYDMVKAATGSCSLTVNNADGKYSPANAASPLTGLLLPKRPMRVRVEWQGVTYDVWTGFIEDYVPHARFDERLCEISAVDGMDYLARADVHVALHENITTSDAITHILDAAGWPAGKRTISTGHTTMPLWWADGKALNEIRDIEDTELGFFYIDGSGNAVFEDRYYRLTTARCIMSQYILNNKMIDLPYTYGARSIFNEVKCPITTRTLGSLATIWTMVDVANGSTSLGVPLFYASESKTFWASFNNFAKDIVDPMVAYPTASYNYRANAQIDNGGVDKTGDFSCVITPFGKSAMIVVTNTGATSAYLTCLNVRGKLYVDGYVVVPRATDATSETAYQPRTLEIQGKFRQDIAEAQSTCDYILSIRKNPQAEMDTRIRNKTDSLMTQMLARKISDRITIMNDELGVSDGYYINAVKHTWSDTGLLLDTIWTVAKAEDEVVWVLGVSPLGESTRLAS